MPEDISRPLKHYLEFKWKQVHPRTFQPRTQLPAVSAGVRGAARWASSRGQGTRVCFISTSTAPRTSHLAAAKMLKLEFGFSPDGAPLPNLELPFLMKVWEKELWA